MRLTMQQKVFGTDRESVVAAAIAAVEEFFGEGTACRITDIDARAVQLITGRVATWEATVSAEELPYKARGIPS